ncbi:MAG: hypothetical protein GY870_11715 [archaeon]|nr:hypothetical protein [archaeon]
MNIPEFDELKNKPTPENAMKFGSSVIEQPGIIQEKKELFKKAFDLTSNNDEIEAILNMWAVASMLEDDLEIPRIIQAVRGFLKDPQIKPEMVDEWIKIVYKVNRAPFDILDFITIDLRYHPGISSDLKEKLSHSDPTQPFRE